ncbi:hypothetical protein S101258_02205 [Lactiplantibacillus plantarum subsp. plantarum]|uniref:Uncharacterized protein n=1 Tax=Lactiplantibacillus plantarum subsp. plantarum TaxID=337330 RepID=A0A2S3U4S5_LACPN|nr:hypothetical protein S101258_02205 [Lactiplantibacillus plantarum subsp. plantarum]
MTSPKNSNPEATANRRTLSLTSMYFNRFLLFRYVTAIFFFVNLYWAIILFGSGSAAGLLPTALLIGAGVVIVEQVSKFWKHTNQLTLTRWFYWVQILANAIVAVGAVFGPIESCSTISLNQTSFYRGILSLLGQGMWVGGPLVVTAFLIAP